MAAVAASWLQCSLDRRQGCRPRGNDHLQVADLGGLQLQSAGPHPPPRWAGHSKCCAHVSWWCRAAESCSKGYHKGWRMGCGQSVGPVCPENINEIIGISSSPYMVSLLFSQMCVAHQTSEENFESYIYAADGLPSKYGLFTLSCNWYTVQGECSFMHAHVKFVTKKRCVNLSRQQGCAMYKHPQATVQTSSHTLRTYLLLHKLQAEET